MEFKFLPFTQNVIRDQLKELRDENKKLKGMDFLFQRLNYEHIIFTMSVNENP